MAYEESLQRISGPVGANENTNQYKFVTMDSTGNYNVTGNGLLADGVLQDNPNTTGFIGLIGIAGVSKVLVGPNGVTVGDSVMADTNGGCTTKTSTNQILGRALATGVSGDIIPVLLKVSHG